MHTHTYVYIHARLKELKRTFGSDIYFVCVYIHMCVCVYIYIYIYIHAHMYTYRRASNRTFGSDIYYVYIYTYIHTHSHTHTYVYIQARLEELNRTFGSDTSDLQRVEYVWGVVRDSARARSKAAHLLQLLLALMHRCVYLVCVYIYTRVEYVWGVVRDSARARSKAAHLLQLLLVLMHRCLYLMSFVYIYEWNMYGVCIHAHTHTLTQHTGSMAKPTSFSHKRLLSAYLYVYI